MKISPVISCAVAFACVSASFSPVDDLRAVCIQSLKHEFCDKFTIFEDADCPLEAVAMDSPKQVVVDAMTRHYNCVNMKLDLSDKDRREAAEVLASTMEMPASGSMAEIVRDSVANIESNIRAQLSRSGDLHISLPPSAPVSQSMVDREPVDVDDVENTQLIARVQSVNTRLISTMAARYPQLRKPDNSLKLHKRAWYSNLERRPIGYAIITNIFFLLALGGLINAAVHLLLSSIVMFGLFSLIIWPFSTISTALCSRQVSGRIRGNRNLPPLPTGLNDFSLLCPCVAGYYAISICFSGCFQGAETEVGGSAASETVAPTISNVYHGIPERCVACDQKVKINQLRVNTETFDASHDTCLEKLSESERAKYKEVSHFASDEADVENCNQISCPFCLEPIAEEFCTIIRPCLHTACRKCLETWIDNGENVCMTCRGSLTTNR